MIQKQIVLLMLLIVIGVLQGSGRAEPDWLTLKINLTKHTFVLGEPIIVNVALQNNAEERKLVPHGFVANLFFDITLPSGSKAASQLGIIGTRGDPPLIPINPQDALRINQDLLDSYAPLDQPGRYVVTTTFDTMWYYPHNPPPAVFSGKLQSNTIAFEITPPNGVDAEAFRLIQAKMKERAQQLPPADREGVMHSFRRIIRHNPDFCEHILQDFPTSTYAQYARFYLAQHYHTWYGETLRRQDDIDKAIEHYRKVLTDYPKCVLSGQAQWGIARCYFLKKDYPAAKREAEKVIKDYPDSFAAQEAKKLKDEIGKKQGQIEEANTSPGK